jgi:hypothetical protein
VRLINEPTVVVTLVYVTKVVVTEQGAGEHPPTLPWRADGKPITIAEPEVSGCPRVKVTVYVLVTPICKDVEDRAAVVMALR